MNQVFELMEIFEVQQDIGRNLRAARAAMRWRQEDLAKHSGVSLQAIKNLEAGRNAEMASFLRVLRALGLDKPVWQACQPVAQTLDELERIETALIEGSRVRGG